MIAGYVFDKPNIEVDIVYALSSASDLNGTNNMLQVRSSWTF
jgi:hypothetical protein